MPAKKSSSMLKTIVSLAKSLGELNHRSFLLKEELKALHLQGKEDSAFLKRRTGNTPRRTDHRRALKDHVEYLARMQCLAKQELEQVERLSFEIEQQMGEIMRSLSNSLARSGHASRGPLNAIPFSSLSRSLSPSS